VGRGLPTANPSQQIPGWRASRRQLAGEPAAGPAGSAPAGGWLAAGWRLAGGWLAAGWRLAGGWLAGWRGSRRTCRGTCRGARGQAGLAPSEPRDGPSDPELAGSLGGCSGADFPRKSGLFVENREKWTFRRKVLISSKNRKNSTFRPKFGSPKGSAKGLSAGSSGTEFPRKNASPAKKANPSGSSKSAVFRKSGQNVSGIFFWPEMAQKL